MSSSGANPFTCEALVDSARCGRDASYVHKSASSPAMLFCDACAKELKASSRGMRKVPIVEFSLFELIPPREGLIAENGKLREAVMTAGLLYRAAEEKLHSMKFEWRVLCVVSALSIGLAIWGWVR